MSVTGQSFLEKAFWDKTPFKSPHPLWRTAFPSLVQLQPICSAGKVSRQGKGSNPSWPVLKTTALVSRLNPFRNRPFAPALHGCYGRAIVCFCPHCPQLAYGLSVRVEMLREFLSPIWDRPAASSSRMMRFRSSSNTSEQRSRKSMLKIKSFY